MPPTISQPTADNTNLTASNADRQETRITLIKNRCESFKDSRTRNAHLIQHTLSLLSKAEETSEELACLIEYMERNETLYEIFQDQRQRSSLQLYRMRLSCGQQKDARLRRIECHTINIVGIDLYGIWGIAGRRFAKNTFPIIRLILAGMERTLGEGDRDGDSLWENTKCCRDKITGLVNEYCELKGWNGEANSHEKELEAAFASEPGMKSFHGWLSAHPWWLQEPAKAKTGPTSTTREKRMRMEKMLVDGVDRRNRRRRKIGNEQDDDEDNQSVEVEYPRGSTAVENDSGIHGSEPDLDDENLSEGENRSEHGLKGNKDLGDDIDERIRQSMERDMNGHYEEQEESSVYNENHFEGEKTGFEHGLEENKDLCEYADGRIRKSMERGRNGYHEEEEEVSSVNKENGFEKEIPFEYGLEGNRDLVDNADGRIRQFMEVDMNCHYEEEEEFRSNEDVVPHIQNRIGRGLVENGDARNQRTNLVQPFSTTLGCIHEQVTESVDDTSVNSHNEDRQSRKGFEQWSSLLWIKIENLWNKKNKVEKLIVAKNKDIQRIEEKLTGWKETGRAWIDHAGVGIERENTSTWEQVGRGITVSTGTLRIVVAELNKLLKEKEELGGRLEKIDELMRTLEEKL